MTTDVDAGLLHRVVRWRIFSRSQVSDGREAGLLAGKPVLSYFSGLGLAFRPTLGILMA